MGKVKKAQADEQEAVVDEYAVCGDVRLALVELQRFDKENACI